jgi:hypothetical protein
MAEHHERPAPDEYAAYYAGYVARVPAGDIVAILETQIERTRALLASVPETMADHAYAPGKWTIREVIGHLSDAERVFAYRALRFGRGDTTELAGFDENAYVPAGGFGGRSLASLIDELVAVRKASVALFRGLPAGAWLRRGVASGHVVTVRALAWIMAGHELHHRAILEERYGAGAATAS